MILYLSYNSFWLNEDITYLIRRFASAILLNVIGQFLNLDTIFTEGKAEIIRILYDELTSEYKRKIIHDFARKKLETINILFDLEFYIFITISYKIIFSQLKKYFFQFLSEIYDAIYVIIFVNCLNGKISLYAPTSRYTAVTSIYYNYKYLIIHFII